MNSSSCDQSVAARRFQHGGAASERSATGPRSQHPARIRASDDSQPQSTCEPPTTEGPAAVRGLARGVLTLASLNTAAGSPYPQTTSPPKVNLMKTSSI